MTGRCNRLVAVNGGYFGAVQLRAPDDRVLTAQVVLLRGVLGGGSRL